MAKAIMIQGAGSNVGKSMVVAGLARAFTDAGLKVAPFKPQNMSNNAAVTEDGGEIGRAQSLQARAARRAPITDMNPVLLKPESDIGAQIILQGKRIGTMKAREYGKTKSQLIGPVLESFHRLASDVDLVLVEGAGSPAEVNLRAGDIANMGFAEAADIPVVLVGDIDRGGVIAQLVGTHTILPPDDRNRIKGFAVNKFRGDVSLFDEGRSEVSRHTDWCDLGVLPWFEDAWKLPAEDVMDIASRPGGSIRIAVPRLNRIANFDDLDPLAAEPDVDVELVEAGRPLPGDADLILIPGSKSTIADLTHFRAQGWDVDLHAHIRRGGRVLGVCGGYQMLGRRIHDPEGIEGAPGSVNGLGHLDIETRMTPDKRVQFTEARHIESGTPIKAYEIHIGQTDGPDRTRAWLEVNAQPEGAASEDGKIKGCYLHGLFTEDAFRRHFLAQFGGQPSNMSYDATVEATLDDLAAHIRAHMDLDKLLKLAEEVG